MEILATILGLSFGTISTLIAVRNHVKTINKEWRDRWDTEMQRQADSKVKEYAAQRDFEHLSRHQDQMKEAIRMLQEETEEQGKILIELKTLQTGLFNQFNSIAAKMDGSTAGWARSRYDHE